MSGPAFCAPPPAPAPARLPAHRCAAAPVAAATATAAAARPLGAARRGAFFDVAAGRGRPGATNVITRGRTRAGPQEAPSTTSCSSSSSHASHAPPTPPPPPPTPPPPFTPPPTPPLDATTTSSTVFRDWSFKGFKCCYAVAGEHNFAGPDIVLVHGFGANCRHWRKNMGPLAARGCRVFAMDVLGFGLGDKPTPGTVDSEGVPMEYTIEYWSEQLLRFCSDVVRKDRRQNHDQYGQPVDHPLFLIANSIGSMVTMQASVLDPSLCRGHVFIAPSMRQLHVRKRSWLQSITAPLAMRTLSYRPLGAYFLKSVARPDQLRRVLLMAYSIADAVDEELIQLLREPALTPGALDVFLSFITYDSGPVPEDLMPLLSSPSLVIWGEQDKFEPYEEGRALRHYATVEQFVALPGIGHCAHDEAPDLVNQLVGDFIASNSGDQALVTVDF